jgi:hypothetical protein
MVLYAYVMCLRILASSRMFRSILKRQTPYFLGGSVIGSSLDWPSMVTRVEQWGTVMVAWTSGHRRRLGGCSAARCSSGPRGGGSGVGGRPELTMCGVVLTVEEGRWWHLALGQHFTATGSLRWSSTQGGRRRACGWRSSA